MRTYSTFGAEKDLTAYSAIIAEYTKTHKNVVINDTTTTQTNSYKMALSIASTYRGGNAPDGRKVKGTIHWVPAKEAVHAKVRLYENLVDEEKGKLDANGNLNLNPNSLTILEGCKLEPALKDTKTYDSFQFVRNGYFCVDAKDSAPDKLVFNRIVSLKSSFKLPAKN